MTSQKQYRILMILENGSYPEDSRVLLEARSLTAAGYFVTVVCPTGASKRWHELLEEVRVYRYPQPIEFEGLLGYLAEFVYSAAMAVLYTAFILMRHGFDAIHIHTPPDLNISVGIFAKLFGKKIVFDHHDLSPELYKAKRAGSPNQYLYKTLLWWERLACRTADRLIATNETQQQIQIDRCGANPDKCVVVRNGPNKLFLKPAEPHSKFRDDPRTRIGYVGMIAPQDGVDQFVLALGELKKTRDDFLGIVVGSGSAIESLRAIARENGIEHQMVFTGMVPFVEVPSYIAAFDICVTPDPINEYNDSCTTIKTMEYMAQAKPIVAFGTKENRITAQDAALYASGDDVSDFAKLMKKLMDDPELRETLGQRGYRRVQEELAWDQQKNHLVGLYDGLSGKRSIANPDQSTANTLQSSTNANTIKVREQLGQVENGNGRDSNSHRRSSFLCNAAPIRDVFEQAIQRDVECARLSPAFTVYYQVRSLLPIAFRHKLQQVRNRRMEQDDQWYLPISFLRQLSDVLENNPQEIIHPWPDAQPMSLVLTHDVETDRGFGQIGYLADIEEELGFRSAWNVVPKLYDVDDQQIRELDQRGFEVGVHGYNHDGRLFSSAAEFNRRVPGMQQAFERFNAVGFRAPMAHRNLDWIAELDPKYDASCFDIDPFQAMPGGIGSIWPCIINGLVELPYTMPQDHTLFVSLNKQTTDIWQNKFDFLRRRSGMALMVTHPDYLDTPARRALYKDFLKQLRDEHEFWHALPRDVARWWRFRDQNLDQPGEKLDSIGKTASAMLYCENGAIKISARQPSSLS